jgi:hypothetical protein
MNRRTVLLSSLALFAPAGAALAASLPPVTAYRDPGCSCCEGWAEHLKAAGFAVTMNDDFERRARRLALGIADELASCHTAIIGDLVIEGHVPAGDIMKLLANRPAGAYGLAVPEMPAGSPGMGPEGSGPPYVTLLLARDAAPSVFAEH